jgi:hypothetical protein
MRKLFAHKGFLELRAQQPRGSARHSGVVFEAISPAPGYRIDLGLK